MAENVTKDEIGRTHAFKHLSSEGGQPGSHGRVLASVALVVAAMSLNPVCAQSLKIFRPLV